MTHHGAEVDPLASRLLNPTHVARKMPRGLLCAAPLLRRDTPVVLQAKLAIQPAILHEHDTSITDFFTKVTSFAEHSVVC